MAVVGEQLKEPFKALSKWNFDEVKGMIQFYKKNDLPFGIGSDHIQNLLSSANLSFQGSLPDDIVRAMCKNNGLINALALLSGMVIFSSSNDDNSEVPAPAKFDAIFNIFDFNDIGEISMDEVGILLMSLLYAMHTMTGIGKEPHEVEVEDIIHDLSGLLGKSEEDKALSKIEFRKWMIEQVGTTVNATSLLSSFGFHKPQGQSNERTAKQNAIRGKQLPSSQSFQHPTEDQDTPGQERPLTSAGDLKNNSKVDIMTLAGETQQNTRSSSGGPESAEPSPLYKHETEESEDQYSDDEEEASASQGSPTKNNLKNQKFHHHQSGLDSLQEVKEPV
mmetsp:Transcript_2942/g.4189  ORF Transcript_2942/g.4189 Transcript_2942/m.4189 type:complete len:334 (+) Transcript_2942:151-1152(+)